MAVERESGSPVLGPKITQSCEIARCAPTWSTIVCIKLEPPRVVGEVAPLELLGGADARVGLSARFAASAAGGALTYSATVDDPRLAASPWPARR